MFEFIRKSEHRSSYIIEIILLLIVVCTAFLRVQMDDDKYFDLYDFEELPDNVDLIDGVVTVREDTGLKEDDIFAVIPAMHLNRGHYTTELSHESDADFKCRIYDKDRLLKEETLKAGSAETNIDFDFQDDIYNFRLVFSYPGKGTVTLKHVTIHAGSLLYTDTIIYALLIIVMILFVFRLYRKTGTGEDSGERRLLFILLVAAAVIINYPVYSHYIQGGADFDHHLSRIENIRTELLRGQFPVVIYPEAFGGRGGMGALYPSVFLYIPAVLRILGMSIPGAYKVFEVLMNTVSMFAAWYAVIRITGNRRAAFVSSVLYAVLPYRILVMYFRDAVGEAQGVLFIPFVIAGLYDCIEGDRKKWIPLAIGMAGAMNCHTLSVGMLGIACIIFGLIYIKKIINEKRYIPLFKSVALFLLLSAWTLVPFLYYYGSDIDLVKWLAVRDFSRAAIIPAQLFMLTKGMGSHSTNGLSKGIVGEDGMSLGFMGIAFFIIVLIDLVNTRERDNRDRFAYVLFLISCLFNFMSTSIFPWATLEKFAFINNIVRMIQFPTRFQSIGLSFLVISGVVILYNSKVFDSSRKLVAVLIMSFSLLQGFMMMDSFLAGNEHMTTAFTPHLIDEFVNDYVPYGFDKHKYKDEPECDGAEVLSYSRNDTNSYVMIGSGEETMVKMPLVIFKGYRACMEDGNDIPVYKGENGELCVKIPASDMERKFRVFYDYPVYFTVAAMITAITALLMIIRFGCGIFTGIREENKLM